jgi:hypothetical protein
VEVRLLSTEAGGRRSSIQPDYRPDWDVGNTWLGSPTINGGRLFLDGRDDLAPGEQCVGHIDPLAPELWGRVRVGSMISAQEGSRVVGHARVLEIFDCPDYWSPDVARFVDEAKQFCVFVEQATEYTLAERLAQAQRRLLELYMAAVALPQVKPTEGDDADANPPRPAIEFDMLDAYSAVFDPYADNEVVGASLTDDFGDIYSDLKAGLDLWKSEGSRINAIWQWRFMFDAHWGRHAINALGALHHARNPSR